MKEKTKIKASETKSISLVIPAYKAEKFIAKNLIKVKEVLDQIRYSYEIICVVDGKMDSTYEEAEQVAKKYPGEIKVTGYLTNMGKGHAVRFGMAQAKGDIVGYIDAGMDLDPNSISMLLEHFEWYDADIIVGSKRHPVSKVDYPFQRKVISLVYYLIAKILFGLKIHDTQVGLKFYKRKVLEETLPRLLVKQYAFDIELLAVANYLGYKRIFEGPVELDMEFGQGISSFLAKGYLRMSFLMLWDTLAVFYRLKILYYYDDKNRKNWITPSYLTFKKNN